MCSYACIRAIPSLLPRLSWREPYTLIKHAPVKIHCAKCKMTPSDVKEGGASMIYAKQEPNTSRYFCNQVNPLSLISLVVGS